MYAQSYPTSKLTKLIGLFQHCRSPLTDWLALFCWRWWPRNLICFSVGFARSRVAWWRKVITFRWGSYAPSQGRVLTKKGFASLHTSVPGSFRFIRVCFSRRRRATKTALSARALNKLKYTHVRSCTYNLKSTLDWNALKLNGVESQALFRRLTTS